MEKKSPLTSILSLGGERRTETRRYDHVEGHVVASPQKEERGSVRS
jgi:hypothetical protein